MQYLCTFWSAFSRDILNQQINVGTNLYSRQVVLSSNFLFSSTLALTKSPIKYSNRAFNLCSMQYKLKWLVNDVGFKGVLFKYLPWSDSHLFLFVSSRHLVSLK